MKVAGKAERLPLRLTHNFCQTLDKKSLLVEIVILGFKIYAD